MFDMRALRNRVLRSTPICLREIELDDFNVEVTRLAATIPRSPRKAKTIIVCARPNPVDTDFSFIDSILENP
jgi:hypothetical protein